MCGASVRVREERREKGERMGKEKLVMGEDGVGERDWGRRRPKKSGACEERLRGPRSGQDSVDTVDGGTCTGLRADL
jgi:hypothetical protein